MIFCCCKRNKSQVEEEGYELSSSCLEESGTYSTQAAVAPSTISSKAKNSHPLQRIKILQANESLPSVVSRAGSVFVTPENTNPYYPNPNTPIDEEACGIVTINPPFCPPNNTPIETSDSESGSQSHLRKQFWSSYLGSEQQVMSQSESYVIVNNLCMEHHNPLQTTEMVSASPAGINSLSLHSTDINNLNVPIHSSTIAEADDQTRRSCSLSHMNTDFSNISEESVDNLQVEMTAIDIKGDTAQPRADPAASSPIDRTLQWHYNKAYEDDESDYTDRRQRTSLYTSLVSSGGWKGSLSYQVSPSGHTSIIAQAGSVDLSSVTSNYETRCLSASGALYSIYTDSSLSISYRPAVYQAPANTPQAPASSPLTVQASSFEYYINKLPTSPSKSINKHFPGVDRHPARVDRHLARVDKHPVGVDKHPVGVHRHPAGVDRHIPGVDIHTAGVDKYLQKNDRYVTGADNYLPGVNRYHSGVDRHHPGVDGRRRAYSLDAHRQISVKVRRFHSSFRKTINKKIISPQNYYRLLHQPLLSPKTYWV